MLRRMIYRVRDYVHITTSYYLWFCCEILFSHALLTFSDIILLVTISIGWYDLAAHHRNGALFTTFRPEETTFRNWRGFSFRYNSALNAAIQPINVVGFHIFFPLFHSISVFFICKLRGGDVFHAVTAAGTDPRTEINNVFARTVAGY